MEEEKKKKGNVTRWWLQLQFAFFSDKRVRALRRKYGDLSLIIYQKMMLKSLENECTMKYEGLEDTFEEEIAVDIVEDEKVSLIKDIMQFLIEHDLMVEQKDSSYFFPQAAKMSGSETDSAERMRRKRERDKEKASQCDGDSSPDAIMSDDNASHCEVIRTDTDLHLKSDKSKTLDVQSKTNTDTEHACADSGSADRPAGAAAAEGAAPQDADLFSVKQLLSIAEKNKINLTVEGIKVFYEEMHNSMWILYDRPVEKNGIVKALRGWAKYHQEYNETIVDKIYKIAHKYISNRRFEENPGGLLYLIQKYCPKEAFTEEQLKYMEKEWKLYPKQNRYLSEVDEYLKEET